MSTSISLSRRSLVAGVASALAVVAIGGAALADPPNERAALPPPRAEALRVNPQQRQRDATFGGRVAQPAELPTLRRTDGAIPAQPQGKRAAQPMPLRP